MSILSLLAHDKGEPLLFSSGTFFFFFTLFLIGFALVQKLTWVRITYVLAFSLFYYFKCNGAFMVTLLGTTLADYTIARQLAEETRPRVRKAWVASSVVLGLGVLGYFKYANFFLANLALVRGTTADRLDIFLPIGISFYTFQSLSYVVDVYRREVEPCDDLLEYAFYLSFFPQIVAGPIVRACDLLPQIRKTVVPDSNAVFDGLFRIVSGIVKKSLLADYIGIFCDLVFDAPNTYGGFEVGLAIYGYALQIYFDFSGYSDIAIGMALIVGFTLPENFRSPYRATSITDFWRRWHITLSTWLRDYLYIPLGGNQKGGARQVVNLMITMLLGGLWHGASWNFVVWGGLHGVGLAVHKGWTALFPVNESARGWSLRAALGWFATLHFVIFLWVFFRARDFASAWQLVLRLGADWELARVLTVVDVRRWLVACLVVGGAVALVPTEWGSRLGGWFRRAPLLARAAVFLVVVQLVVQVQQTDVQPFIYFQF
jgi:D-alanyl-lipoteichoic acid acyltransferase DltB (MBOAT superfamily)